MRVLGEGGKRGLRRGEEKGRYSGKWGGEEELREEELREVALREAELRVVAMGARLLGCCNRKLPNVVAAVAWRRFALRLRRLHCGGSHCGCIDGI